MDKDTKKRLSPELDTAKSKQAIEKQAFCEGDGKFCIKK